jgi:hypothetical protein
MPTQHSVYQIKFWSDKGISICRKLMVLLSWLEHYYV